jgi:hypothetical protein
VLREKVVKQAWDTLFDSNEELLFCARTTNADISTLHPNQIQIFKLWQVYLESFSPLLKVTHTPTLQKRIIDAASDVTKIDPPLEALMFSIYCVSIFSLDQAECIEMFHSSRHDLLKSYQLGAREALLNCRFLRTEDRDCLTALHLYLVGWSGYLQLNFVLIVSDDGETCDRPALFVFDAWCHYPHCSTHGHP